MKIRCHSTDEATFCWVILAQQWCGEYLIFWWPFPTLVTFDNIKTIFQFVNSQSSWLYYNLTPFQVGISWQLHCAEPNGLAHEKQLILDLISYFLRKWIYLVNRWGSSKKNWKEVHPREINGVPSHIFLLINVLYFLFLDIIMGKPAPSSLHSGQCDDAPFIPSSGY